MKKLGHVFFALVIPAYISFIPSLGLATDRFEDTKPVLKRSSSQEELFQLQEQKAALVQQVQDLQKRERHWEIEKLRKEVAELKSTKLSLQTKLEIPVSEIGGTSEQEIVIQPLTPIVANRSTNSMEDLLLCITTNYNNLRANMHPSRGDLKDGSHIHYPLAKLSDTSLDQVRKALAIIQYEKSLIPHHRAVQDYVGARLLKFLKNEYLYSEDVSLENVDYLSRFYVMNYDPSIHKTHQNQEFEVFAISSQPSAPFSFLSGFRQLIKGKYKDKLSEFLKRDTFEHVYVYKNTLYCNYGFTIRNTSFGGFLFLEKPFDVHLFY